MTVDRDEVIDALRNVEDPELEEDIVTLEMVESLEIDGSTVLIGIDLPSERMKDQLDQDIRSELSDIEGVSELKIDWGDDEEEHESEMLPDVDNIIAVSSGKGGVGKSTFSVNLAVALAQEGYDVGLFDADVYGPNVPRMIGKSAQPRVSKDEMIIPPKKYGMKVMSMGFLAGESTPVVWRGALVHNALTQLLGDVEWGDLDYFVVDLPPGTGDAQLTIAQMVPVTGGIIVTTPQKMSIDDARKGVEMFKQANVPVAGIVENMSEFVCPDCGNTHDIFGEGGGQLLADESDVPLLGQIPLDPKVRDLGDEGKPIVLSTEDSPAKDAFMETSKATRERIEELSMRKLPML